MHISSIFRYTTDLLGLDVSQGFSSAGSAQAATLYGYSAGQSGVAALGLNLSEKQVMSLPEYSVGALDTVTLDAQERVFLTDGTFGALHIGTVSDQGKITQISLASLPSADPVRLAATMQYDGQSTLVTFSTQSGGFEVYTIAPDWTLETAQTVEDGRKSYANDVTQTLSHTVGGTDFLLTLSGSEDGLSVYGYSDQGVLELVDSMGIHDGLGVSGGADMAVLDVDGESFVVIAGQSSNSVTTLRINDHGVLFEADHYLDSSDTSLHGASHIAQFSHSDRHFLAVAGTESGVSILEVTAGGQLTHVANVEDDRLLDIRGWASLEVIMDGDEAFLLAAPLSGQTLVQITLDLTGTGLQASADAQTPDLTGTQRDDLLIGDAGANTLSAGAGDDVLRDGAGQDVLYGGAGADMFVFSRDDDTDVIGDFEVGIDRIDLSGLGLVRNMDRLDITPTSDGAVIDFFGQQLVLHSSDGSSITPSELTADQFILG